MKAGGDGEHRTHSKEEDNSLAAASPSPERGATPPCSSQQTPTPKKMCSDACSAANFCPKICSS
jgi:hypothetical protein